MRGHWRRLERWRCVWQRCIRRRYCVQVWDPIARWQASICASVVHRLHIWSSLDVSHVHSRACAPQACFTRGRISKMLLHVVMHVSHSEIQHSGISQDLRNPYLSRAGGFTAAPETPSAR